MKDLRDLKSDKEHHLRCAEDIMGKAEDENRSLDEKEQKDYDVHLAEMVKIDAEIDEVVKHNKQKAELAAVRDEANIKETRKTVGIPANAQPGVVEANRIELPYRSGANLKCFRGPNGPEEAYKFGAWFGANILRIQHYQNKWRDIRDNSRALSETINTAGGALVPTQFADFIINLREEFGVFQTEAFSWPMTSDTAEVPRVNGRMSAAFFGEGAAMTTSDLAFASVLLVAKKAGILTYVSNELNEDAMIEVADLIATEMGHEFAEQIDNAGFNGTGTAAFAGINGVVKLIEDNIGAQSYVNAESGNDSFDDVTALDLSKTKAAVADRAHRRGNAKWYCSRAGFEVMFSRLQQAAGGNTSRDVAGKKVMTYDGNDVVISQVLQTSTGATAQNNLAFCLFGDLSQAAIFGNRRSISIAQSGDFRFSNDQTAIRAIQRFDVTVVPEVTTTAGTGVYTPVAALIGNT